MSVTLPRAYGRVRSGGTVISQPWHSSGAGLVYYVDAVAYARDRPRIGDLPTYYEVFSTSEYTYVSAYVAHLAKVARTRVRGRAGARARRGSKELG